MEIQQLGNALIHCRVPLPRRWNDCLGFIRNTHIVTSRLLMNTYRHDTNDILQHDGVNVPSFAKYDPGAIKKFGQAFMKYVSHVHALQTGQPVTDPRAKIDIQEKDIPKDSNNIPLIPPPFLNSREINHVSYIKP